MRRRRIVLVAVVSAICILEILSINQNAFLVSTVKASTGSEEFSLVASCYMSPTFPELIFGMILFFTPLFALALIAERASLYRRISKQIRAFREDDHAAAQDFLAGKLSDQFDSNEKNHISEVVSQSLRGSKVPYAEQSRPRIQIEQARQRALEFKKIEFEKRLWAIETIAITMPLICLFGSTISFIDNISWMRCEDASSIWPLISAIEGAAFYLIYGLGIAIPAFWIQRLLSLKAKRLIAELDDASARLLDLVLNYQPRPWLLEPKSRADVRATQSFSKSTLGLTWDRQA